MTSGKAYICNRYGIHCRPSAIIVKAARKHDATVKIVAEGGQEAEATNALGLIGLGIVCEETVTIEVEGASEEKVCEEMIKLFETNFDFQR
ncbi:MAG: HPr family phosphocarrier protein [Lentisphaeria bacterium]